MAALKPGLAFSVSCGLGFAVGLMTHHVERIGHLVWIAVPVFGEEPTVEDVTAISQWRWPVFFPLGAAIRRKIVTPIGVIPVPPALVAFPTLRGGNKQMGWMAFTEIDGVRRLLGLAHDSSIPISKVVNDVSLKQKIVSGWMPEQEW